MRKFPFIVRIIDLKWEGEDFNLGIISRLVEDVALAQPIIDSKGLNIRAQTKNGCWILISNCLLPPESLWRCYESIGQHLTAAQASVPQDTD